MIEKAPTILIPRQAITVLNGQEAIQEINDREENVSQTRKASYKVFDGMSNLVRIENDSIQPEKLLGLDIRDAINHIIDAMKNGQDLDEIIKNVTIRPDFNWSNEDELREKFNYDLMYSFMTPKRTRWAKGIFERLLQAGKIAKKDPEDNRNPGNSQAVWIGEGTPWEK